MRTPRVILLALGALAFGCSEHPGLENEDEFRGATAALTKGSGGVSGADVDYCNDPLFPCDTGEGDCDSNTQCTGALVCGIDNGPQFGHPHAWDVCVPDHCENGVRDADETFTDCGGADCGTSCGAVCDGLNPSPSINSCNADCPCALGESDCNSDLDCMPGLVCGENNGPQFNHPANYDTCVPAHCTNGVQDGDETDVDCGGADCGSNCTPPVVDCGAQPADGHPSHCSVDCPCPIQEGDCDSHAECVGTAICVDNVGDYFGFAKGIDMCLADHCNNSVQDGDELGTDCGPSCTPCDTSSSATAARGGANSDNPRAVAVDSAGNTIVVGTFRVTTDLGNGTLTAAAGSSSTATDIFVAKYASDGSHVWSQRFGGTLSDGLLDLSVAVSSANAIVVSGDFNGTVDFGDGPRTTTTSGPATEDAFVMVLESTGAFRWVNTFGGPDRDTARAADFDTSGNVIVTGQYTGTTSFGGASFTSAGGTDIFVAKYNGATGAHMVSRSFGGMGTSNSAYAIVSAGASTYIAGSYLGAAVFGTLTPTSAFNTQDGFVVRLNGASLAPITGYFFGGIGQERVYGLAADSALRVSAVGQFSSTLDFGAGDVSAVGATDAFVLGLNPDTTFRWVNTFGGAGYDIAYAVDVNTATRNILVAGVLDGSVSNWNGGTSAGFGGRDSFRSGYNTSGVRISARRDGGSGVDVGYGVSINGGVNAYVGLFSGTASFSGSSLTSAGSYDMFTVISPN